MSGETIEVYGTTRSLEAAGIGIANAAVILVSNLYDKMASDGGAGYPNGRFTLTCSFATAPLENSLISLYAREYPPDGSNRTDAPEATRPGWLIGSFVVNDRTGNQTMVLYAQDLPPKADYYLHNNGTGQSISSGWVLNVTPQSYKPAP